MRRAIDEHAVKAAGGEVLPDGCGVRVGGWRIATTTGPIAGDATSEALKEELGVLHIPEQFYSSNRLTLIHESTGVTLAFDAASALRSWHAASAADAGHRLHVPASEQWLKTRRGEMEAHGAKELDYDWTFTTDYIGNVTSGGSGDDDNKNEFVWGPTSEQMDRGLLTARDPILFFDDLPLYESELEDNGVSSLRVKVRVMPRCWYVLLSFFLRVDGVMVRLREARLFCRFDGSVGGNGNEVVLREIRYQEGRFEELAAGGAPPEGPAYADGDVAATALTAVAPVGVTRYVVEKLALGGGA